MWSASPRSGSSSPASRTPNQYPPSGAWPAWRAFHTTGMRNVMAAQPRLRRMPGPLPRPRARDLGLRFGAAPAGPLNAITDVPGVRVGHVTLWHDDPVARTGVTAI